jgi:polysaccharide export outer membrane protein
MLRLNMFVQYLRPNGGKAAGLALMSALWAVGAWAQTSPAAPPTPVAALPTSSAADERYRIGPGDVLDIRVFNRPQLSRESVRVEGNGMVRMPMIDEDIRAACLTEIELGKEIAKRYLRYIRRPQVDVFIKEYQSQPVAVLGSVRNPSQFKLQRRVRLLELLSYVGGPSEKAGRTVQIVHTAPPSLCEVAAGLENEEDDAKKVSYFKLEETLNGDDTANPFLRPGDIVNITEAEQVYVVGNVFHPVAVLLREPLTVTSAIAKAGGVMPDTKRDKVRIIRQFPGSTAKTEVLVDLKAIEKRQAPDPLLQPNDIIDVPASEGKKFVRSLVGAVLPGVGQLPVRVVP